MTDETVYFISYFIFWQNYYEICEDDFLRTHIDKKAFLSRIILCAADDHERNIVSSILMSAGFERMRCERYVDYYKNQDSMDVFMLTTKAYIERITFADFQETLNLFIDKNCEWIIAYFKYKNTALIDKKYMIPSFSFSGNDIFGLGKIAESICRYLLEVKKLNINVTPQRVESLYNLLRKDQLSVQPKTKILIDKILKKCEDEPDFVPSMDFIKVVDFMDDELLEMVVNFDNDPSIDTHYLEQSNLVYLSGVFQGSGLVHKPTKTLRQIQEIWHEE